MQLEKHLNEQNLLQICQYIKKASRIDTGIIDDNVLATNKVFSNAKVTQLLLNLELALKNYSNNIFNKISHLSKEIVTTLDATTANDYTLYLLKKIDSNGDEYFEQNIFDSSTKTFTMIGTTKNTGMNNVKFYQNDTDYYINDIVLYKSANDYFYSIYVCKVEHNSGTSFVSDNWEIVDEKRDVISISTTPPSDRDIIWVDVTYIDKPIIKVHNGINWIETYSNSAKVIDKVFNNVVANTPIDFNVGYNLGNSFLIDVYGISIGNTVRNDILKEINDTTKNTFINNEKEVDIISTGTNILDESYAYIITNNNTNMYESQVIDGYKDITELEVLY